jgi:hypothetical protein
MAVGYLKINVAIGGDQLIMHNGQTADPLNKFAKLLKEITDDKTRKKTAEGIVTMGRIECEAGLYLNAKKQVILPSRVLEAHISEGARKTKEGKQALAGMFVDTDGVLSYDGGPLSVAQILDSEEHQLRLAVAQSQGKVMRVRPFFKNWTTTFQVSVLEEMVSPAMLKKWLLNGGNFVGIGDYRPRYGRYELRKFEVQKASIRAVA